MRLNKLILSSLMILFGLPPTVGQVANVDEPVRQVVSSEKSPDLAADFSQVARLKLASHKAIYRLGEMLLLNVAMLNAANKPIFVEKISRPQLYLYDEQGRGLKIVPYIIVCLAIGPDSFELLEPNLMTSESIQLLVGCNDKPFDQMNSSLDDKDDKRIFENNLFINYGRACLNVTRPSTYTIKARLSNDYVIESPGEPNIKTAVGSIESEPLTIQIIE